jgi:hypothetical protein
MKNQGNSCKSSISEKLFQLGEHQLVEGKRSGIIFAGALLLSLN